MVLRPADREVVAVAAVLALVGSLIYAASLYRSKYIEPFTAIGLLNENCFFGGYPSVVVNGDNVSLCILLVNFNKTPALFRVVYRVATPSQLPSNSSPSGAPVLGTFLYALPPGANETFHVTVPVVVNESLLGERVALVFELWRYAPSSHSWVYTGKWVHIYVRVLPPP